MTYVVPGVLVLCAGFGAALTAVRGLPGHDRRHHRQVPVHGRPRRGASSPATSLASTARNADLDGAGVRRRLLVGFRPHGEPAGWLAAAGILLAFILAISWLAATSGLLARSPEAANGITFLMMFLPYASSAFVPIATMPAVAARVRRPPTSHPDRRQPPRAAPGTPVGLQPHGRR